jgi:hypothetical protein
MNAMQEHPPGRWKVFVYGKLREQTVSCHCVMYESIHLCRRQSFVTADSRQR